MKRFSLFLFLALFINVSYSAYAALDFSVFQTRGFEGKGELEFNKPEDIIEAPDGNYLISDTNNNRIQVLDSNGNFLRLIPPPRGKNESLQASPTDTRSEKLIKLQNTGFKKPVGMAFDSKGMLYVALSYSDQIVGIDYTTGQIQKVFGSNGKKQGQLWMPMDLDIDEHDRLAVAEFRNRRVQILTTDGECIKEILYQEENSKGGIRQLEPRGVLWTQDGNLIVTYPNYHQVVCWDVNNGSIKWRYGGDKSGKVKGSLYNPSFVCLGVDNHLMISDTKNNRIVEITKDGKYYEHHSSKGSGPGKLNTPRGLFLNSDETLLIVDSDNSRLHFFCPGQATLLLKEAKTMALNDDWVGVMANIEKILYLQPNNEQAMDLMVNALYFFGDKAYKEKDYNKAEDYYRRVLRYRPDDGNIPQKLDLIFWENNQPLIVSIIALVLGIIGFFILIFVLKLVIRRIKAKVKA